MFKFPLYYYIFVLIIDKNKNKKIYHTVVTIPKSNEKSYMLISFM